MIWTFKVLIGILNIQSAQQCCFCDINFVDLCFEQSNLRSLNIFDTTLVLSLGKHDDVCHLMN